MIFAASQMSPKGCLIMGIVCLAVGILEFAVIAFYPRFLKRVHWGRFGGGPPMSRIGAAAWGVFFVAFGIAMIMNGYFRALSSFGVGMVLLAGFIQLFAAGFYDMFRHKR
jgi:hypothetical protein